MCLFGTNNIKEHPTYKVSTCILTKTDTREKSFSQSVTLVLAQGSQTSQIIAEREREVDG